MWMIVIFGLVKTVISSLVCILVVQELSNVESSELLQLNLEPNGTAEELDVIWYARWLFKTLAKYITKLIHSD